MQSILLTQNWEFLYDGKKWYPADVPGCIHTDLLKNKLIPDPFYGCNEYELQWIGERNWTYRKVFHVDRQILKKQHVLLVFDGLDTFVSVYVNGKKLLYARNMFRKWEIYCKDYLQHGDNLLELVFESALNNYQKASEELEYPLPGGKWVLARKAAYHFGWDWGPCFITAGIWQPVYLKCWDNLRLTDLQLFTRNISDQQATIRMQISFQSDGKENASVRVINKSNGELFTEQAFQIDPSAEMVELEFQVADPVLWWTNDLGEPYLYDFQIEIATGSGQLFNRQIAFGIRTIQLERKKDTVGESFRFLLNGVPLFIKGANYIPQHSFVTETDDEAYEKITGDALRSNMNMLRVWGGGIYEKDIFYALCDRKGLLVWQDFMFACAMYPGDDAFAENVAQEVREQIKRLRNHPCIALWCGNNEVDEAWHNWQWQETMNISEKDCDAIWSAYQRIFHQLIPGLVAKLDPDRQYLSSSPVHGWGHEESMTEGDAHYWGVWWGLKPVENYIEKVPRFMSEFGLQAMPTLSTIRQFQDEDQDTLFSKPLQCHQKHPTGYESIQNYLDREFLEPEKLEDYIYMSQLMQMKGIGLAIEVNRTAIPRCMGSLYWQLNDCWPVTSWSAIDANGNWKALQYAVRNLFDDVMVSLIEYDGRVTMSVVSGLLKDADGVVECSLVDFNNDRISLFGEKMTIRAGKACQVIVLDAGKLRAENDLSRMLIEGVFETSDGKRYVNQKFLEPYGKLNLPPAKVKWKVRKAEGGCTIDVSANAFTGHLQLYLAHAHAWFGENFFHLWAGDEKSVFCQTGLSPDAVEQELRLYHMNIHQKTEK